MNGETVHDGLSSLVRSLFAAVLYSYTPPVICDKLWFAFCCSSLARDLSARGESVFSSAYLYVAFVVWSGLDVGGFTLAASSILG